LGKVLLLLCWPLQETLDKLGQVTRQANLDNVLDVSCAVVHFSVDNSGLMGR
jgi:hypothetical protein